jgi:hypothetical protein
MSDPSGPPDTRPPNKPPGNPPPPSPPPSADAWVDPTYADALLDEVDRLLADLKLPARRDPSSSAAVGASAIATTDGPGFTTPQPLGPPRFAEGEHRLVGHVGPPAEASGKNPRPQVRPPKARPYGSQPLNPATPYRKP